LVYKLCQRNELGSLPIGGALRFSESAIESFLAALEHAMQKRDTALLWLCTPGASYVVDQALTVDGG
jgi:hypothetical protein